MTRADVYLTQHGFAESRTRAARLIDEGKVIIDGKAVTKAGDKIADGDHDVVITQMDRFVSRGGLKLLAAIEAFGIEVEGKRCIDIGASTGGFTDCLLQFGAQEVVAIDSGSGQLHESLSGDQRVLSIEGFNAKNLDKTSFGAFDVAVMDVSFISQTILHKNVADVLDNGGVYVSLIKPQFEAGRAALSKKGIVKDPKDRERAVLRVLESALACGFSLIGIIPSPIEGGDGNHEYVACFARNVGGIVTTNIVNVDLKSLCK